MKGTGELRMIQIIFIITMYPLLPILYFCMRNAGAAKNGYSFGVRMKQEWVQGFPMQGIIADYKKQLKHAAVILAVIPAAAAVIPYLSISISIWTLWIFAVVIVPGIPYARANGRTKELKKSSGWVQSKSGLQYAEMKNAGEVRRVKGFPFLLPVLISAAAAGFSFYRFRGTGLLGAGFVIAVFAAMTLLFYLVAVWADRQKIEVVSSNSGVNVNYSRAKKNVWKNLWLACAWLNTGYTVFFAAVLELDQVKLDSLIWGTVLLSLILLFFLLWTWKKVSNIEEAYAEKKDFLINEDDDCWIWGIFYYNKKDKHTMVSSRAGISVTTNMATPLGMTLDIIGLATILAVPILCIWLILEELTPIQLSVENNKLLAEHLKTEYQIPLENIGEISLMDEKPDWSKVKGTGMENLSKGTFYIRNEGKCEAFLNPQNAVFIKLEADGRTYYMSGSNDQETLEIYNIINGF